MSRRKPREKMMRSNEAMRVWGHVYFGLMLIYTYTYFCTDLHEFMPLSPPHLCLSLGDHCMFIDYVQYLKNLVVKSDTAAVHIPELDFEVPPTTQVGVVTTVEGIITEAISGLGQEQPTRRVSPCCECVC